MLGDVLYRPELMFPQQSEAWHKSKSGGFVSRYDGKVLLVKRVKNGVAREMEISLFCVCSVLLTRLSARDKIHYFVWPLFVKVVAIKALCRVFSFLNLGLAENIID